MANRRFDRWERVVPIKHKDNIVSSQFYDQPKFVASYENDRNVDMFSLMSHEYAKQWRREKEATKRILLETQDSDFLMRRYVIRGFLAKKKVSERKPRFIMKRFQNIPAKIKMHDYEDDSFEAETSTKEPKACESRTSSGLEEIKTDTTVSSRKTDSIVLSCEEGQGERKVAKTYRRQCDPCRCKKELDLCKVKDGKNYPIKKPSNEKTDTDTWDNEKGKTI